MEDKNITAKNINEMSYLDIYKAVEKPWEIGLYLTAYNSIYSYCPDISDKNATALVDVIDYTYMKMETDMSVARIADRISDAFSRKVVSIDTLKSANKWDLMDAIETDNWIGLYNIEVKPFEDPDLFNDGDLWFDYEIRTKSDNKLLCKGQSEIGGLQSIEDYSMEDFAKDEIAGNLDIYLNLPSLSEQGKIMQYCVECCQDGWHDGMCFIEPDEFEELGFTEEDYEIFKEEASKPIYNSIIEYCDSIDEDEDTIITCYGELATMFNRTEKSIDERINAINDSLNNNNLSYELVTEKDKEECK